MSSNILKQCFRELEFGYERTRFRFRRNGFSSFQEEQILAKYVNGLLPAEHSHTAVDIGAGDGQRRSNTYALFLQGWNGVGIEFDSGKFARLTRAYKNLPNVQACRDAATPQNIVPLLKSYGIKKDFSVLSLDINGNDYWVLRAILSEFRPHLVVSELNEKIPPPIRFAVKYNPDFRLRHHFFGYSISVLEDLCAEFDYSILQVEYNNAFIAPRELARERAVNAETAYAEGYLNRADRKDLFRSNADMETMLTLPPEEAIEFLRDFYSKFADEYYLGLDRAAIPTSIA